MGSKKLEENIIKYHHVRSQILNTPWAILPEKLADIMSFINAKCRGENISADQIAEIKAARGRESHSRLQGTIAVVPVIGSIHHRANMFTETSGGTSAQNLGAKIDALAYDESISAIVLEVDSPGGSVFGVPEVASKIYNARSKKPIVASVAGLAASAAYWLGTAASEMVASPSSQVGSIGVFLAHEDISEMDKKVGIKTTLIKAGKYKTEGNPYEPLSDEAKANMQKMVDEYYELFVEAVARHRGVSISQVKNGFGEGRVVSAKEGLALGMIDRIETLDETLERLSVKTGAKTAVLAKGHGVALCEMELDIL